VPAIVHMTHNSQEEGHGLADVLFGDYSPAGRLTQTWPTGDAQLLPLMDYNLLHGRTYLYSKDKPLYAFGYGLSYTSFKYEGLKLSAPKVAADGSVEVTVRVKNTGKRRQRRSGAVVCAASGLGRCAAAGLELKGFARVRIEAGAERDVTLELKPRDLAYWDMRRGSCLARGEGTGARAGRRIERQAACAGYGGGGLVTLVVDANGNPQNPHVIRALGMGLDEKAVEAVRKYKFKPAMVDGKTPVSVRITVEVNFRL
jgi:TonB family protein